MALVVAGAFGLSCWGFLVLASVVNQDTYRATEEKILRSFRLPDDPAHLRGGTWVEEAARDITALGSAPVLTLLTLLTLGFLLLAQRWQQALLVLCAVVGGALLSSTLKVFFSRERPSVVPHFTSVSDASFPSGHSLLSSVVFLTLGALLAQAAERRREHLFFIIAALLLTVLVGFSRMALGVHYPSDVLAGWSAGMAWALLCWTLAWWWRGRDPSIGGPA